MKQATSTNRLTEPDVLRTLALFGVIAQHILGSYSRRAGVGVIEATGISILFELVRFAVPMFVFLFGMMLVRSKPRKPLHYIGRRAWQLLWPYAIWSVLYFVMNGGLSAPLTFFRQLLLGSAGYHLWYVPMIFQFVLLAPLFTRLFARFDAMKRPAVGWMVLVGGSFAFLLLLESFRGSSGVTGWIWKHQTALFPAWMLYFSIGALCGRYYDAFCRWVKKLWPACLVVAAVAVGCIVAADVRANAAAGAVVFNVVGLQRPHYAALLLVIFICLQRLAMALCCCSGLAHICTFCSKHSYRAYLAHVYCINLINARLVSRVPLLPVYYALLFVLVSACSLAVAWLLDTLYDKAEAICRARCSKG